MTPEEFKAKYRGRVIDKYLAEPDKVLMTAAYQTLSAAQKTNIQRAMEQGNSRKAMDLQMKAREGLAGTLADTRLDEISADGNVSLDDEIDEFL